jgi:putative transposase
MFVCAKYRIYPSSEQEIILSKHFGCCRWIYNRSLEIKKKAWEVEKRNINRFALNKTLPILKRCKETSWLREVNSQSLQSSLINLDMAYTRFFRKKSSFPKFKSKDSHQSFQVPQRGIVGDFFVEIPKVGKIKAAISRKCAGKIKTITISKTVTGKYFASVMSKTDDELPFKLGITESGTIGIDLGLKHLAVISNGEKVDNPRHLNKRIKRLRRAQRVISRRKKCGNNRKKQRLVVARIHERITNTRNDFLHKLTTRLVRDNQTDTFAIEDLAVSNMVKNRRLARSISDAGWGEFRRQLEYKAERAGKNVLVIGRFEPSSKTCSCGKINAGLKLSDRAWTCECGQTHDRDLLAAQNIKRFALHPQNLIGRQTPEFTLEEISQ